MPPLFGKKEPAPTGAASGLKAFLKKDLELTRSRWSKAIGVLRSDAEIDRLRQLLRTLGER